MDPELTGIIPHFQNVPSKPQVLEENVQSENASSPKSLLWLLWSSYFGILMALFSSLFSSFSYLIIKALRNHSLMSFGSALSINLFVLIPTFFSILFNECGPGWHKRSRVFKGISNPTTLGYLSVQGILRGISVGLRTISLAYLSVGDMTVIVFSSPIVTTILAHFLVGEECGLVFILIAIFTLVGIGLMTKPPIFTGQEGFDQDSLIGSAIALGAMLSLSLKLVVTRKIKETHFLLITLFVGLGGVLMSLPLFLLFEDPNSLLPSEGDTTGLLLRIGLLTGFCGAVCLSIALKIEDAGVVALVRSFDVIFAFLLQYLFLGVSPDLLSGIGAVIIWTGVLFTGIRKYFSDIKL